MTPSVFRCLQSVLLVVVWGTPALAAPRRLFRHDASGLTIHPRSFGRVRRTSDDFFVSMGIRTQVVETE